MAVFLAQVTSDWFVGTYKGGCRGLAVLMATILMGVTVVIVIRRPRCHICVVGTRTRSQV